MKAPTVPCAPPTMPPGSSRDKRLLLATRFFRSVGQGVLAADFALYLRACGWSGAHIGSVLGAALVLSVLLTLFATASDRIGRKPFLLGYESLYACCSLAAWWHPSAGVLAVAAIGAGFGRGANGAAGPFGAIEKAWLTQGLDRPAWTRLLARNSTVGFAGMAIGALAGSLPGQGAAAHAPGAYAAMFPLALGCSVICLVCLSMTRDGHRHEAVVDAPEARRTERRNLRRLGLVNLLQGMGIGLSGPLVSYWFAVRFGVGPSLVGPMMAGGFVAAALSAQVSGVLGARLGLMRTIVALRLGALALLVFMPLAPSLPLAVLAYLLHKTLNRGTDGLRASITAGLVGNRRRGLAGAVSSVSRQIPRSFGPLLAGMLMDQGLLAAPFLAGAAFQAAYLYLYRRSFDDAARDAGDLPRPLPQASGT